MVQEEPKLSELAASEFALDSSSLPTLLSVFELVAWAMIVSVTFAVVPSFFVSGFAVRC
jgi:hypothetical protein